jgi:cytochrome c biogenesis protein CcmG/thiol:disulfide interchange protein DsbE
VSGRHGPLLRVAAALIALGAVAGCTGDDAAPAASSPPQGKARAVLLPGCPPLGPQSTAPTALPDLELPCLGVAGGPGPALPLRRLTGRPTVVNLWASWCAPCREELPAFARLARDAGSRLRVVGVASQDREGAAAEYAADSGLPFPSLFDADGELGRGLRRPALPVTVFVGADGAVAEIYQGAALTDTTLRALVRQELGVDVG